MASWKKYFKVVNTTDGVLSPISGNQSRAHHSSEDFAFRNYQSRLPEIYSGHPNRVERYNQYEAMDMDSEVNACLDIIAEFSTQINDQNNTAFEIQFNDTPTEHEISIIKKQLQQWCKLNKFDQRTFKMFRNSIKYGDQVFIRDPETFELYWVDMSKVSRVIVNESEGKLPEQYIIRDMNPNFQNLTVAAKTTQDAAINPPTQGGYSKPNNYTAPNSMGGVGSRFNQAMNEMCIDAKHVVHLSLSEGLDFHWPFGQSILENIYKVFKQKELLEDALLIYRVQRAPERRIFKIDVGNMPSHMAMAYVERIKNEMHQRRIPTQSGGGASIMDATYNPLSTMEDYFFPTTQDGRGSSVEVMPGGANLGEIDDLKYFNNKLSRGLRVPSAYLPSGPDDSAQAMNDGRVGTALIQEYRFNQYCQRLQNQISLTLDLEFKMFMRWRGFNIDSSIFTIKFNPPQNFASYRQAELDTARVSVYSTVESLPYMSKRFMMQRFLGLTADELVENEKLWKEENNESAADNMSGKDLRSVGVSPSQFQSDIDTGTELTAAETEVPATPPPLTTLPNQPPPPVAAPAPLP